MGSDILSPEHPDYVLFRDGSSLDGRRIPGKHNETETLIRKNDLTIATNLFKTFLG